MQEYRIRSTGVVVNEAALRAIHECVFPEVLDESALEIAGADIVYEYPAPVVGDNQRVERDGAVQDVPGHWVQNWVVYDLTQEEIDAKLARIALVGAAEVAEYLAEVRVMRESVLNRLAGIAAAAVITQDTVVTSAFLSVRQQLLEMTQLPAVVAATNREEISTACKAAYANIVVGCPEVLRTALLMVDA